MGTYTRAVNPIIIGPPPSSSAPPSISLAVLRWVHKGPRAVACADILDGRLRLELDIKLLATVARISVSYINKARRLEPEQRTAVSDRHRPLVMPQRVAAEQKLTEIVSEKGCNWVLDTLADMEGKLSQQREFIWPTAA